MAFLHLFGVETPFFTSKFINFLILFLYNTPKKGIIMKKITTLTLLCILASLATANDIYQLSYSKDTNCTLTKNGKKIPTFDKRFKAKAPANGYTCNAIQKEQYNDCVIRKTKNTTAEVFSFGTYGFTNLIIAFKTPTPSVKGLMKVECIKSLKKLSK